MNGNHSETDRIQHSDMSDSRMECSQSAIVSGASAFRPGGEGGTVGFLESHR